MAQKAKTNALRELDTAGITYRAIQYDVAADGFTSGSDIARKQGMDPDQVFKTLVTFAERGKLFVCVIPVDCKLNLKKAAAHFGVKRLEMLPTKDLLANTGYVHGGCSPIGMKKLWPTVFDETAELFEEIYVSGGRIGLQIGISPGDLASMINGDFSDITE